MFIIIGIQGRIGRVSFTLTLTGTGNVRYLFMRMTANQLASIVFRGWHLSRDIVFCITNSVKWQLSIIRTRNFSTFFIYFYHRRLDFNLVHLNLHFTLRRAQVVFWVLTIYNNFLRHRFLIVYRISTESRIHDTLGRIPLFFPSIIITPAISYA